MNIRPIADWRRVLRHAWSVRMIALTAIFSGLEVGFAVFADNPPIPRGLFASLSSATTIAAVWCRFVSQKEFRSNGDD